MARRSILLGLFVIGCGGAEPGPAEQTPEVPNPEDVCGGYPDPAQSPFVLPWAVGETYAVLNGNCGRPVTHRGANRYGYDFNMPLRTNVHAARGGTVIDLEERYLDGNGVPSEDNFILVLHDDGTVARYYHLTRSGAAVKVGQVVAQGDVIGLSGNTGSNIAPNLHFDVVIQQCTEPLISAGCTTVPITFRNTRSHPQGLVEGEVYRAEPF